jgi:hypothetical protein
MVTLETARAIALAFEAAEEAPHFEITSFRIKKKIFLTMNAAKQHVTIRMTAADQAMFLEYNPATVYPVPGKWGKYGWSHINLQLVEEELLRDLIRLSYCMTAPKKLAAKYEIPLE